MRVLGLLLLIYVALVIVLYMPRHCRVDRWRFVIDSSLKMMPALLLAYLIMILAWPWAALAPLNPVRGLLNFSEFYYAIHTFLDGQIYEMANVPPLYVPIYILIRVPLPMLLGAALKKIFMIRPRLVAGTKLLPRNDVAIVLMAVVIPLACQVAFHGPAFTGLRHFLFVLPGLAVMAGIGLDKAFSALATSGGVVITAAMAATAACLLADGVTLARLHPCQYLYYNSLVGCLAGASRRYDLDYWFGSMPEALSQLEAYLRAQQPGDVNWQTQIYSVAVCGERLPFETAVTLPQLRWDFKPQWNESEFFRADPHELRR
jgi:hypothetical protein